MMLSSPTSHSLSILHAIKHPPHKAESMSTMTTQSEDIVAEEQQQQPQEETCTIITTDYDEHAQSSPPPPSPCPRKKKPSPILIFAASSPAHSPSLSSSSSSTTTMSKLSSLKRTKSVSAIVSPPPSTHATVAPATATATTATTSEIVHPQNHRGFAHDSPVDDASGLGMGMSGSGVAGIGGSSHHQYQQQQQQQQHEQQQQQYHQHIPPASSSKPAPHGQPATYQGIFGHMDIQQRLLLLDSPQHKTFQESQDELLAKLTDLAKAKNGGRLSSSSSSLVSSTSSSSSSSSSSSGAAAAGGPGASKAAPQPVWQNKHLQNVQLRAKGSNGSASSGLRATTARRSSKMNQSLVNGSASTPSLSSAEGSSTGPREPRRRINSAQFRTPSVAEMQELAQVVVANASPPKPKGQKRVIRKKPSILSMTTTTFGAPIMDGHVGAMAMHPSRSTRGYLPEEEEGYRLRYEAALKEIQSMEKKFSSLQQQLAYERDCWQERYNELEGRLEEQQTIKAEAQTEKMNALLDTVQELQLANECFRRQLKAADIEPDPTPAADFYSQPLGDDEELERTILEENKRVTDRSLLSNKAISLLSTEITNSCIAISQTINHMQLRFLTQTLEAVEHVTAQKRTSAMTNSFLSDMLSRGVKKYPGLNTSNATSVSVSTQTPPSILTNLHLLEEQRAAAVAAASASGTPSRLTQSLLNLVGLHHQQPPPMSTGHYPYYYYPYYYPPSDKDELLYQFRLKGRLPPPTARPGHYGGGGGWLMDDRCQSMGRHRPGLPITIVQDLKGGPSSPVLEGAVSNKRLAPVPKFQYASPSTSQLRIVVPDILGTASSSTLSTSTATSTSLRHQQNYQQQYQQYQQNPHYQFLSTAQGGGGGGGGASQHGGGVGNASPFYFGRPVAKIATGWGSTGGGGEDEEGGGGEDGSKRAAAEMSPQQVTATAAGKYGFAKTKYPYPYHHSSLFATAAAEAVSSTLQHHGHGEASDSSHHLHPKETETAVATTDTAELSSSHATDGNPSTSEVPVLQVVSPC